MNSKSGKSYISYLAFIDSVKRDEKTIVFGQDYVVLSKKAYDELIEHRPALKSIQYNEVGMYNWFQKRFLEHDK